MKSFGNREKFSNKLVNLPSSGQSKLMITFLTTWKHILSYRWEKNYIYLFKSAVRDEQNVSSVVSHFLVSLKSFFTNFKTKHEYARFVTISKYIPNS